MDWSFIKHFSTLPRQSVHDTHPKMAENKLLSKQRLFHAICNQPLCAAVVESNIPPCNVLTIKQILHMNVLGAQRGDRMLQQLNDILIVMKAWYGVKLHIQVGEHCATTLL